MELAGVRCQFYTYEVRRTEHGVLRSIRIYSDVLPFLPALDYVVVAPAQLGCKRDEEAAKSRKQHKSVTAKLLFAFYLRIDLIRGIHFCLSFIFPVFFLLVTVCVCRFCLFCMFVVVYFTLHGWNTALPSATSVRLVAVVPGCIWAEARVSGQRVGENERPGDGRPICKALIPAATYVRIWRPTGKWAS